MRLGRPAAPPGARLGAPRAPRAPVWAPRCADARARRSGGGARRAGGPLRARSDDEEPDWDREMSIFKERTMRPNQLATLRELESKVSVGKVRAPPPPRAAAAAPAARHRRCCVRGPPARRLATASS
jgi:hypothetical protein